jgi:Beta-propeller repeat
MIRPAKIFFTASLALGLNALLLCAQSAAPLGRLPLWFEPATADGFVAHGSSSEFFVSATETKFTLQKSTGETAEGRLQFVGAETTAKIYGQKELPGKINYFRNRQPENWQTGRPTFARLQAGKIYPGVDVTYYGTEQKLEYDLQLAPGANPDVIALRFDGAEKISVNDHGELVVHFKTGDLIQHAPAAYQLAAGQRQPVTAAYKILDAHTATFALGGYDQHAALVIDPVLEYSTYYGGNLGDTAWSIAVNQTDGSIYVAGQTFSSKTTNSIPFWTTNALQTNYLGGKYTGDAFVARFDNTGTNLIYATYLGGTGNDGALSLTVDATGNAYVTGYTDSTNFPTTPGAYQKNIAGQMNQYTKSYPVDAFVLELNPTGDHLIYSTYLGGSSMDAAYGIAIDGSGNAYVTGYSYSSNFPVTPNAFQTKLACSNNFYISYNAFVAEIAAGGSNLNYSTYLGGTNVDSGKAVAYSNHKLFVTGYTFSTNFPVLNPLPKLALVQTNIYTKKSGGTLKTNIDIWTNYTDGQYLNATTNKKNGYASDAFVVAFDTTLATNFSMLYSTYLGGTNDDQANAIAADATGNCYVAGWSCSTNFPDTAYAIASSFVNTNGVRKSPATNGFLTQIKWEDSKPGIGYSVMFGGEGLDVGNGVALDPVGNAYVVGSATSTNFPVTANNIYGYLTATNNSDKKRHYSDVFVIAFNPDCSALLYSTYLGGRQSDYGNAIAADPLGNVYLTGQTLSTNFPAVNAYSNRQGTNDMFIAKISQGIIPNLVITPRTMTLPTAKTLSRHPQKAPTIGLNWRMFPPDYLVESSPDLHSGWHAVPEFPGYTNGWYHLDLPATNSVGFFRLRHR